MKSFFVLILRREQGLCETLRVETIILGELCFRDYRMAY